LSTVTAMSQAIPLLEKTTDEFRNFVDSPFEEIVCRTYRLNHTYQTVEFVAKQKEQHLSFDKGQMTLWDVFTRLENIVDESDPDNHLPQIFHAFQTAESLRREYPDLDWFHLVGLIHDLGKLLVLPEFGGHPMWAVVGDTFPVGCAFSPKIAKALFFVDNPDIKNFHYSTTHGIYEPQCGVENLTMSWGHDEYLYQVLVHNGCKIPKLGLNVIRFHSFYPWHRDNCYSYFMNETDHETLKWCQRFSQADLYSKGHTVPTQADVDAMMPYYKSLITKYFPKEVLDW